MLSSRLDYILGAVSSKNRGKLKRISPSILMLIHTLITMQFKGPDDEEMTNIFLDRFLSISSVTLRQLKLDYYISLSENSTMTADMHPDEGVHESYRNAALDIAEILLTQHKPDECDLVDHENSGCNDDNQGFVTIAELLNYSDTASNKWMEHVNRHSHVRSNMEDRQTELQEKKKATEKLRAFERRPKRE